MLQELDYIGAIREIVAGMLRNELGIPADAADMECPALGAAPGVAVRSAAAIRHKADAEVWAARLQAGIGRYRLLGEACMERVTPYRGYLLFVLTDAFYTLALRDILKNNPASAGTSASYIDEEPLARARYAQHRMWMLGRKAMSEPACPAYAPVQQALLLCMALNERPELRNPPGAPLTKRALELRLHAAANAALTFTHHVAPRNRPALLNTCGHFGKAAAQLLWIGLQRITGD